MINQSDEQFISEVELSIYRALLGEVIPSLREIAIIWKEAEELIFIYFFHDGQITTAIKDHYSCIVAEVDADYWGRPAWCNHEVIRCDYPTSIPKNEDLIVVYKRREPFTDPS